MSKELSSGLKVLNSRFRLTSYVSTNQDCQTWIARDDDETPFLLKAWSVGDKPDPVLRAAWDRELRVLYRASSSPGAEDCLLVIREAQLDIENGAFILLAEGPGYDALASQLHSRASCDWLKSGNLKRREYRQALWKGLKRVALAIRALHAQQIIHRNVSAESVFVDASEGPETMRLGSFEWSVKVGASSHSGPDASWSIPPEIAEGTSGYSFDSDWYAFGMLLARTFYSLEGWRDKTTRDLNTLVTNEIMSSSLLTPKEREFIRRLIGRQPQDRLKFSDEILRSLEELVRDLAMPAGTEDTRHPLQLVISASSSGLVDALTALGFEANPDNLQDTYSHRNVVHVARLKEFVRTNVSDGLVYAMDKKDRCVLMGKQITLLLRPYQGAEGTACWDFAHASHAVGLSVGDQNYQPASLTGMSVNVLTPREVEKARGHGTQSWLRVIPEIAESTPLASSLSRFHDFLRCTNQLELLLRDAEISAYEIVEQVESVPNLDRVVIRERTRERPVLRFCAIQGGMTEMLQRELDSKKKNCEQVILSETDSLLVPGVKPAIDAWTVELIDPDSRTVHLQRQKAPDQRPLKSSGYLRTYGQYAQITLIERRTAAIDRLQEHSYLLRALAQPGMVFMDTGAASLPYPNISRDLDKSKLAVIQDVLRVRPIYALQGPPGTGKTTLVAHLLRQILEDDPVAQILVTAPGHSAVDVLREKVRDEVFGGTGDLEIFPLWVRLGRERNDGTPSDGSAAQVTRDMLTKVASRLGTVKERTTTQDEWLDLTRKLLAATPANRYTDSISNDERTLSDIQELVKRSASITYCTTAAADLEALADGSQSFDWSIVEEAGKAHGFDLALPLQAGHRWLLLGDQKQLAPYQFTTYQKGLSNLASAVEALSGLPSKALVDTEWIKRWNEYTSEQRQEFQMFCMRWLPTFATLLGQLRDGIHGEPRLTVEESIGASAGRLAVQYRMHPTIGNLISGAFYSDFGGIVNATEDAGGAALTSILHPFQSPNGIAGKAICWIDTPWCQEDPRYHEKEAADGFARYANTMEVSVIRAFLHRLSVGRPHDVHRHEVAILSPYSAQAALLNKELTNIQTQALIRFRQSIRRESESPIRDSRVAHTVDSFQGNEADVVIVSLVRNNSELPGQGVGFLDDSNRLNVLLSRAQKLLVLVGSWDFFTRQVSLVTSSNKHDELWEMYTAIEALKAGFETGSAVKLRAKDVLASEEQA